MSPKRAKPGWLRLVKVNVVDKGSHQVWEMEVDVGGPFVGAMIPATLEALYSSC